MDRERLKPDALLKRANAEEKIKTRGQLKIYLGAAPGVGKTYTMLQEAHQKVAQGLDVVVGVVVSHGRKDIETLIQGLEILPLQQITYKGRTLKEFDIDAALRRNPGIILMDEMAHSNVGDLRHAKRWQDIRELLDRGIDVYTTLNVQHVESLNNDVAGIIHAPIKETVPDSMLELADTIELVDLPPEDLLNRLRDGKVYFPSQAELAKENFFKKGNLIALRELALRLTAARVSAQVLLYREGQGIRHIWSSTEKIMVCVGSDPQSLKLIRSARRLAATVQAEWMAVYVESARARVSEHERNSAIKNLRVAEQLGAETRIISGFDVVKEIMRCAREENCTMIMIWKHIRPRWFDFMQRSLADEVVRASQEINVYIMTGKVGEELYHDNHQKTKKLDIRNTYLLSAGIVTLATFFNLFLHKYVSQKNLILVYIVAVTVVSLLGQIGPALFASILSVVAYVWLFFPTLMQNPLGNIEYLSALIIMIVLTQVISYITVMTRKQAIVARQVEKKALDLHRISKKLASTRGTYNLIKTGEECARDLLDSELTALFPKQNRLEVLEISEIDKQLDEKELGVAQWVYELGQKAGLGTDTLPMAEALYVPLIATEGTIGVLRIKPNNPKNLFTPDQINFMEAFISQMALAIEVDQLQEISKQSEFAEQLENARQVLLKSVTRDLRAPLASIMLTASSQMQLSKKISAEKVKNLGQTIYSAAEQLSTLINNLLEINSLELGKLEIKLQDYSLRKLVTEVLQKSRDKIGKHPIYVKIPADLADIKVDPRLIADILINLLDNAVKFGSNDKPIEILAQCTKDSVVVSISDHGPGIPNQDLVRIFDKFYRCSQHITEFRGIGLGLSICKLLVEAHGGKIWAENRIDGGAVFKFTLPLSVAS